MPTIAGTSRSLDESDDRSAVSNDFTVMVGGSSTVMPSAVEASSAVPRLEESEVFT